MRKLLAGLYITNGYMIFSRHTQIYAIYTINMFFSLLILLIGIIIGQEFNLPRLRPYIEQSVSSLTTDGVERKRAGSGDSA